MNTAILLFLLCIISSFVFRTTGFGFGIVIMTVLPSLMPSYGEATALSGLLAMSMSVVVAFRTRKFVTWRRLLPMLVTFGIISAIAIFTLKRLDDVVLRKILGVILVLISIYFTFFSGKIHLKTTLPYQIGAGTISGFMGGFFGMQGPPAVLYFVSSEPDKDHYLAMMQHYLLLGNIMMTCVRWKHGFVTPTVGLSYLYGIGGVIIGANLGSWVFKRIPNKYFKYVVYGYIAVAGIIIFVSA
ncbi:MAG: sulfite exporter TauE/SafE family protein [Bacteroidales bacterium]|nr:sulfite exporter TauE/SafE family protein [Bacteroidales bacterium]